MNGTGSIPVSKFSKGSKAIFRVLRLSLLSITGICLIATAYCQRASSSISNAAWRNCFDTISLSSVALTQAQVDSLWIQEQDSANSVIWYKDSVSNLDTVRVAYKSASGVWISFPTPFTHTPYNSYKAMDIDGDGTKELMAEGYVSYQTWPRGSSANTATIIFRLGSIPAIIFQCTTGCFVSNLGSRARNYDDAVDVNVNREVNIIPGIITVGALDIPALAKRDKRVYKRFCRLNSIPAGIYTLKQGTFRLTRVTARKKSGFSGK